MLEPTNFSAAFVLSDSRPINTTCELVLKCGVANDVRVRVTNATMCSKTQNDTIADGLDSDHRMKLLDSMHQRMKSMYVQCILPQAIFNILSAAPYSLFAQRLGCLGTSFFEPSYISYEVVI